jgi:hypothetical protein
MVRLGIRRGPPQPAPPPRRSFRLQVGCRKLAVLTAFDVELHLLALEQLRETGPLERRDVDEHVLRAVVGLNEAEPSGRIEPLDRTGRHDTPPASATCGIAGIISSDLGRYGHRMQRGGASVPTRMEID